MNAADAFDFFHLATARPIYIGLVSWLPVGRAYALNSYTFLIQMAFSLRLLVVAAGLLWVALLRTRGTGLRLCTSPPIAYDAGWSSQEYSIFRLADRVLSARTYLLVNGALYLS